MKGGVHNVLPYYRDFLIEKWLQIRTLIFTHREKSRNYPPTHEIDDYR